MVVDAHRRARVAVEGLIPLAKDYLIREGRVLGRHLLLEDLGTTVTFPDRTLNIRHRLVQGGKIKSPSHDIRGISALSQGLPGSETSRHF